MTQKKKKNQKTEIIDKVFVLAAPHVKGPQRCTCFLFFFFNIFFDRAQNNLDSSVHHFRWEFGLV